MRAGGVRRILIISTVLVGLLAVPAAAQEGSPPTTQPSADTEIVGGTVASAGEYPFQVALVFRAEPNNHFAQFCGGSVISEYVVLTAAHCLEGLRARDVAVLEGTHDLESGGVRRNAKRIRQHPRYDDNRLLNDIAVVETAVPMTSPPIRVAVPGEEALWAGGGTATATGWGATNAAGTVFPTRLREVDVTLRNDAHCRSNLGPDFVGSIMLCAGEIAGGKDTCSGDSGGPIMVDDDGEWVQVGITSWGDGCAQPNKPGVYAEVGALHGFADDYIGRDHPFADAGLWLLDAVEWVHDNDYMSGYPDCTFRPNLNLSRAQAIRLLWRLNGEPAVADPHPFSDVPPWVDAAVRWAAKDPDGGGPLEPVINGFDDGTFRPDLPITRGQWTRMLHRDAGAPAGAPPHPFTDVPGWVAAAVDWIADPGNDPRYAEGFDDGTYRPNAQITRGQATRMVFRIYSTGA